MLVNPSMVGTNPFLERWHKYDKYRKSLSDIGLTEEQILQYDELAFEDDSYVLTKEQRIRNRKGWANQRPDFVEAKRELKTLHDEHVKETSEGNTPTHPKQRSRQRRNQQFEGLEMIIKLTLAPDGSLIL